MCYRDHLFLICVLPVLGFYPSSSSSIELFISDHDTLRRPVSSSSMQLDVVGQVGGPTNTVAVDDKYVFVGQGMRMVILDASKHSRLRQVGSTEPMPGFVNGIDVSKGRAFLAVGGAGIYTVDVENPRKPRIVGHLDILGYPEEVRAEGQYLYVANGWAGLLIIDISDPENPVEVGSITTLGYVFDVVVTKSVAYLAAAGAGLKIVDVKDPRQPVEIGSYNTAGYAYGLDYHQTQERVYIADGWEGMAVVDVSNPQKPALESAFKTPGWAFDVKVGNGLLYVADSFKGLRIVNISSPSNPNEIGSVEFEGHTHAGRLAVSKNTVYVADRNSGLRAVDVSQTTKPRQRAFVDFLDYASGITLQGKYACVATRRGGVSIVDISNPAHPKERGLFKTDVNVFSIISDQRYVFVGAFSKLYVLDISNPKKPEEIGCYEREFPIDMAVRDDILYIANEEGLLLIDVRNPNNPKYTGFIELYNMFMKGKVSATKGIALHGNYAYLVAGLGGIIIVDVSNQANLKIVGHYKDLDYVHKIIVSGGYAFTIGTGGLTILDLSNPVKPTKVGEFYSSISPESISIDGGIAFLSVGGSGLVTVDISNPENPVYAGSYNTFGYAQGQYVSNELVYLADQDGGLVVLKASEIIDACQHNKYNYIYNASNTNKDNIQGNLQVAAYAPAPRTRAYRVRSPMVYNSPSSRKSEVSEKNTYRSSNTLVVTNPADSGPGTLRECIDTADTGDIITFDSTAFPPDKPTTIALTSRIRWIEQGNITIDAGNAGVILDGKGISGEIRPWGLCINSDGNVIRGLQILNFPGVGIEVRGNNNVIGGDRTLGNGPVGQGNVVSASGVFGIDIVSDNNIIKGNIIGLNSSGTRTLGNGDNGIHIYNGNHNRVGGSAPGERNIISGNGMHGILIVGIYCTGNIVEGNFIGTDINGVRILSNRDRGVYVCDGAYDNTIKNNLIVVEDGPNIDIFGSGTSYNSVIGNLIGTDVTGTKMMKARCSDILVGSGADFNRIGGTRPSERNIICLNGSLGLSPQTVGNVVIGNYFGLDVTGTHPFESLWEGLSISSGTRSLFVGGLTEEEGNRFGVYEVSAVSSGSDNNVWIAGNSFGESVAQDNLFHENSIALILSETAEQNVIQGNSFACPRAISVAGNNNVLIGNSLTSCQVYSFPYAALVVNGSENLIFHNNLLENLTHAWDEGDNSWDWAGGGNYWSDYHGVDANGDGIGDTPYYIPSNGVDHYPLMRLFILPVLSSRP